MDRYVKRIELNYAIRVSSRVIIICFAISLEEEKNNFNFYSQNENRNDVGITNIETTTLIKLAHIARYGTEEVCEEAIRTAVTVQKIQRMHQEFDRFSLQQRWDYWISGKNNCV